MKPAKKKKIKHESEFDDSVEDQDDNRPVRFEALAELTNSEVIQQVKNGLSRIAPIENESEEEDSEESSY